MYDIQIASSSRYRVNKKFLVTEVEKLLKSREVGINASVSIFLCGRRKMRDLSRRYLRKEEDHDVLSFPFIEIKHEFVDFPGDVRPLGEIVVCYPLAQNQAMMENKLVDEVVADLVKHGVLHLLGEHHE